MCDNVGFSSNEKVSCEEDSDSHFQPPPSSFNLLSVMYYVIIHFRVQKEVGSVYNGLCFLYMNK